MHLQVVFSITCKISKCFQCTNCTFVLRLIQEKKFCENLHWMNSNICIFIYCNKIPYIIFNYILYLLSLQIIFAQQFLLYDLFMNIS